MANDGWSLTFAKYCTYIYIQVTATGIICKCLLPFTLCVNFMKNGLKETAQNDLEKHLVPLTYIKSKEGFFLLL